MSSRKLFLTIAFLLPLAAAALVAEPPSAAGDGVADKALADAVKHGQALWRKSWRPGAKACQACHLQGPNKMTGRRLRSYPKYDKALRKVVSARQKINHMIKAKSGGQLLDLGSDDLTALEAYIATLR